MSKFSDNYRPTLTQKYTTNWDDIFAAKPVTKPNTSLVKTFVISMAIAGAAIGFLVAVEAISYSLNVTHVLNVLN